VNAADFYVVRTLSTFLFSLLNVTLTRTPRNRLLEKLIGSQLVKKFSAFYGTQSFITAFTRARNLSVS
jgi:hypothetical protein